MKELASHSERVLSFWHKVEFFESTSLKDIKNGHGAIHYHLEELLSSPDALPWLNKQQVRRAGAEYRPETPYTYMVYLGIFKRSEIFDIAKKAFPDYLVVDEERHNDEGLTCSLTLKVKADGRIDVGSISVSTAPWALGMLQQGRLNDITMSEFNAAVARFQVQLHNIFTVANNLKQTDEKPSILSTLELVEVLKAMELLTSFQPKEKSVPSIIVALRKENIQNNNTNNEGNKNYDQPAPAITYLQDNTEVEEDETSILNSFFIQDIETIIQNCHAQGLSNGSPLACYLSGQRVPKPDLLRPEGQALITQALDITNMPKGRWPSNDAHSMSLMQQFAINKINKELSAGGLYSVNGPPGTGKTTMLRDLVANNIVKRAEILARLSSSQAAFLDEITTTVNGEQKIIKRLIPELTGFEIVVASSNNAAVENVTQELPQTQSLGEHYRSADYFAPVAQKLAAHHQQHNEETYIIPAEKPCWGLVAAALGNSKNRSRLGTRIFFKRIETCKTSKPEEKDIVQYYRTLIPALKQSAESHEAEQNFRSAQNSFLEALEAVDQAFHDIKRLQKFCSLTDKLEKLEQKQAATQRTNARVDARYARYKSQRTRFWPITSYLKYRKTLRLIDAHAARTKTKLRVHNLQLAKHKALYETEDNACKSLRQRYKNIVLPTQSLDLEQPDIQRTTFGHCIELNRLRAQLTLKAFDLHQAWLVAVYADKENKLWQTMSTLMPMLNGSVVQYDAAKALWQLLFMIIPVISSTFASFSNQFKMLKEGDIGWLFIDEAGQAAPQQATGALWRAKRAVVVGDPRQIEPVFTVPPCLVDAMARQSFGDEALKWSPTTASVQTIADMANAYGTYEIASPQWVGSPLRVHRRCLEPMFSIANHIAYNNKMIHGMSDPSNSSGSSRWKNIVGDVEGNHFVPRQAEFIIKRLEEYYQRHNCLPALYIISPFKAVAVGIKTMLKEHLPAEYFGGKAAQQKWLNKRIGTVHTFQGKEEDTVILVLGLSAESQGSADWASSKPNLLNVALTRAKKRIYIIGDSDIWGKRPYFSEAWSSLGKR